MTDKNKGIKLGILTKDLKISQDVATLRNIQKEGRGISEPIYSTKHLLTKQRTIGVLGNNDNKESVRASDALLAKPVDSVSYWEERKQSLQNSVMDTDVQHAYLRPIFKCVDPSKQYPSVFTVGNKAIDESLISDDKAFNEYIETLVNINDPAAINAVFAKYGAIRQKAFPVGVTAPPVSAASETEPRSRFKVGDVIPIMGITTLKGSLIPAYRFQSFIYDYLFGRKNFDLNDYNFSFGNIEITEEHLVPNEWDVVKDSYGYIGKVVGTDYVFHNQYPIANSQNHVWTDQQAYMSLSDAKLAIKERPVAYVTVTHALDEIKDWINESSDETNNALTKALHLYQSIYQQASVAYPEYMIVYKDILGDTGVFSHAFVLK